MFAGLLFFYRVCLFWLIIASRVISDETSVYHTNLARRNGAWLPRIKSMELTYTDKEITRRESNRRRQNIYDGTEYDWENNFPSMEETPIWPPDFNAWPQTPTQPPTQVVSQVQQMLPTQVPIQAPYQVPSSTTPQNGPLYNPPKVVPNTLHQPPIYSGINSGTWRSPLKAPPSTKPLRLRAGNLDVRNASRVCSPGPPLGVNPLFRNCLIIGDSISLGYLTAVKSQLQGLCQVQHAPFAKASGAVDSRYGLECLPLILSTTSLEPTSYDAIVFNFGMHDIDYSKVFPEEFVPLEEYSDNLSKIKDFLLLTGAKVAFALTTPVPVAGRRHRRVVKYNTEAKRVMQSDSRVEIVDLYSAVTHICGEPPYSSCSIMKRPKDVHFNPKGNKVLGVLVATTLKRLLSKAKPRGQFFAPEAPELSAREGLASSYFHDDTSYCPDMVTRCPVRTTCSEDLLSLTGYGCCMEASAVVCADSWHCCPRGSHCSPDCNFRSCKCLFMSSSPASLNISNVVKTKDVTVKKLNSKSSNGSKVAEKELSKAQKPATLVKASEHKIVSMKHKVGIGSKNGKKNEKNRKDGKMKEMGGKKSIKDQNEKNHKHRNNKTKYEKHRNHMKSQKGKLHQKDKTKTAKVNKPLSWKDTKTEPSLNKHLIKANPTHRRTNYHASTKQYWVTRINKGLGLTTKRKPNIKFAHAWGKGKQNLSYRSNEKHNAKPGKKISMKEELKNLILKYRQDLRAKLELHSAKKPFRYKGLGLKRQRGKVRIKNLHVANNKPHHRIQRRKKLSKTKTRVKTPRKLKRIDGGRPLKSALSINIVQNHNSTSKEAILQDVRPENKTTNNLESFERGNDKIVTDSDFSGLRQTIREKELAKGDISQSKSISSERTIANNITDKNTMREIRIRANIKTSEKHLVWLSNGISQRVLPEQNNSPRSSNGKEDELRSSLNLHQSKLDDFEKNYSAAGSTSQEDQGSSTSGAVLAPSDNERSDRVTRHPIRNVGSANGLIPLSSFMGEYGGDSGAGSSAEFDDEEESLPESSLGPEAMFSKTRTSWSRAGMDETEKLEKKGVETDRETSGSGVAQTQRILDESRDPQSGFVTMSPEMESPESETQNLTEQRITEDVFSGSGFHTEAVTGDSTSQLSIPSKYRDANNGNIQPSTRRLPMDYNLNVYQNRAERKIGPTPSSHGNFSLSTEGESESGDQGYFDSRNVINFQKHSSEEESQDSTRTFDRISLSKELSSPEGLSTFSSADYGQDLSSSGSESGEVLVVDSSGAERGTTSYVNGLHFGGENNIDKQRASKREEFRFGDSLLCVISPDCKT